MDLKNRLTMIKKENDNSSKNGLSKDYSISFFDDTKKVNEEILPLLLNKRNLIFITEKASDADLIFYDLQRMFSDIKISIAENINDKETISNQDIKIVKNPDCEDIVKIFEYILYGYKPFIFNINFENDNNVLNKLQTIIAINYKNLNYENINTLINSANPVFVSVTERAIKGIYETSENKVITEEFKTEKKDTTADEELLNFDITQPSEAELETGNEPDIYENIITEAEEFGAERELEMEIEPELNEGSEKEKKAEESGAERELEMEIEPELNEGNEQEKEEEEKAKEKQDTVNETEIQPREEEPKSVKKAKTPAKKELETAQKTKSKVKDEAETVKETKTQSKDKSEKAKENNTQNTNKLKLLKEKAQALKKKNTTAQ